MVLFGATFAGQQQYHVSGKSFGKTQGFRVQDLLEEPGDRIPRDVPGDTFS